MNIQAMMKQAQKLQKDMMNTKEEIESKTYETTKSFVEVKMKGNKQIESIKINIDTCEKDDIEMIEDLVMVAVNDLIKEIDAEMETKMGKFTQGMPGLF